MIPRSDHELLSVYLESTLGPDEETALQVRLVAELELAEALVRLAREEAVLTEWAGSASAVHATIRAGSISGAVAPLKFTTPLARWCGRALIAASVLLAALLLFRPRETDVPALAQLDRVEGEVYVLNESGETTLAHAGQKLFAGQGVRTSGESSSAVVKYMDATLLELAGDTYVHLIRQADGKKIELAEGAGGVSDLPDGKDLVISTPHAEMVAQNGKFSFVSQPDGGTRVESERGRVKMTRKRDGKSVLVNGGQYAVASRRDDAMQPRFLPALRFAKHDASGPVRALLFMADGQTLVEIGGKGPATLRNSQDGEIERTLDNRGKRVAAMALSADRRSLVTAGDDRMLSQWDLATAREHAIGKRQKSRMLALACSPDGHHLLAACDDKLLRFLDPATGLEQVALKGHRSRINAAVFSPNGRFLATGGGQDRETGEVRLWNAVEMKEIAELPGYEREVLTLAFSPDSRLLAAAGRDGIVRIWDVAAVQVVRTLYGRGRPISAVAFSPDGKLLAAASCDGLIKLWDSATGAERLSFKAHKGCVGGLAFSPDGKFLASGGADRAVKLWELTQPPRSENVSFRVEPWGQQRARCLPATS